MGAVGRLLAMLNNGRLAEIENEARDALIHQRALGKIHNEQESQIAQLVIDKTNFLYDLVLGLHEAYEKRALNWEVKSGDLKREPGHYPLPVNNSVSFPEDKDTSYPLFGTFNEEIQEISLKVWGVDCLRLRAEYKHPNGIESGDKYIFDMSTERKGNDINLVMHLNDCAENPYLFDGLDDIIIPGRQHPILQTRKSRAIREDTLAIFAANLAEDYSSIFSTAYELMPKLFKEEGKVERYDTLISRLS